MAIKSSVRGIFNFSRQFKVAAVGKGDLCGSNRTPHPLDVERDNPPLTIDNETTMTSVGFSPIQSMNKRLVNIPLSICIFSVTKVDELPRRTPSVQTENDVFGMLRTSSYHRPGGEPSMECDCPPADGLRINFFGGPLS